MNAIYEEIRIGLHNVWLRRWLALAVAWGVALIAWLVISGIPNKYESKASVYVQTQSLLPDKLGISPGEQQKGVEQIQRTLLAADNLEKVVRGTDLGRDITTPRSLADAVAGLRGQIEIVAQQDGLFEISAESGSAGRSNGENAKLAKDIVQKLLDLFVEGNLAGGRTETTQTLRFLDQQLALREQELRQAEAKRVEFEQKYMGLLPGSGMGTISQRIEAVRNELNQIDQGLMSAQSALAALNGQMGSISASVSSPGLGGGGGPNSARAAQLEGQMAEAQSRGWTANHPDMIALRGQLSAARSAAAREGGRGPSSTSAPNPMYVTLRSMQAEKQATVASLSARRAQLQAELAQFASKQVEEPGIAAEQSRLTRDYDVLKTQYDKLLRDREDVRLRGSVQSETNSTQFRVIEPPTPPRAPVAPNRPLLLTLALLAAVAAGAAAAFGMSQIKAAYSSASRLMTATGLPVVGSISEILAPAQQAQATLKLKYFAGCSAALLGAWLLLMTVEFIQRGMVA